MNVMGPPGQINNSKIDKKFTKCSREPPIDPAHML